MAQFTDPSSLDFYYDKPQEFIEDAILSYYPSNPKPTLNRHQIAACNELKKLDYNSALKFFQLWLSIRSGRGKGKTAWVAWVIMWYLATRPMARVICTGPKADLLSDVLWAEINKWLQFSPLREILEWTKEKILHVGFPINWYAVARTAKYKENFSGFHERNQLVVGDEASGIPDEILETIEQTQMNNVNKFEFITILISNPTKITGFFFKTQTDTKWLRYWRALHFKPTEEEVAADPGAQRTIDLYGIDHDITRVSVYGEFPSGNPKAVISYADAWDARMREVEPMGNIEIGVDVARFGDDMTVICYRWGYHVYPLLTYKKSSTVETEQHILDLVTKLRHDHKYERVIRIKIDDSSMGGGVVDHLRMDKTHGIDIISCIFGGAGDEFYANSASIMWAELKSMITKLEIPQDEFLFEEIVGRNWGPMDQRARQKVESKDDFKKRIKRSPDRADSLVLCCANSLEKSKILPKLVHVRTSVFRQEKIRFDLFRQRKVELLASVWHERDMRESVLAGQWDKENGVLTLFFEGVSRFGGPEELLTGMGKVCEFYSEQGHARVLPRNLTWYGNRAMFGLSDAAMEFTNIKDGPYLTWQNRYMIMVQPNFFFDIMGSILVLNKMIEENRLVAYPDLEMLKIQLETWAIDNDRPDTEGRALCMCLCNIVSMLIQSKKIDRPPKKLRPYGVEIRKDGTVVMGSTKEVFVNRVEKLFTEGRRSAMIKLIPRAIKPNIIHD